MKLNANLKLIWIICTGKVYDVTDYISKHPGGRATIMEGVGKDATNMFMQVKFKYYQ